MYRGLDRVCILFVELYEFTTTMPHTNGELLQMNLLLTALESKRVLPCAGPRELVRSESNDANDWQQKYRPHNEIGIFDASLM